MTCNVGTTDRVLRIVAGIVLIAAGFVFHSWFGLIGLVPLLTAAVRFCPAYSLLGVSTNK